MQAKLSATLLLFMVSVATSMPMAAALPIGPDPEPSPEVSEVIFHAAVDLPIWTHQDDSDAEAESENQGSNYPLENEQLIPIIIDNGLTLIDETIAELNAAVVDDKSPEPETAPTDESPSTSMSTETETFGDGVDSGLLAAGLFSALAVAALAATKQSPLLRIIGVPIASLFSRLQGSQLLNQPRRAEIHELICQTPGITIPDLADASGLSRNTILHHLRMMEKEHLIVSDSSGRSVHWFENGGRYGRERKAAYSVLQDERSRDVAKFIVANPGTSQCKVAGALGLAASVITWHLQRLERAELIHRQPMGRTMQCYPNQILPSLRI